MRRYGKRGLQGDDEVVDVGAPSGVAQFGGLPPRQALQVGRQRVGVRYRCALDEDRE